MGYYLVIALQVFCVYHLIKKGNPYYWILLIIFLPVVGCIVYLVTQVYNKRDVEKIQEELTTRINPTKKIRDLEQVLEFSETFQNRVNLADALYEIKDFESAIQHYKAAIASDFHDDAHVHFQLIKCYHFLQEYKEVIAHAEPVSNRSDFKGSQVQFYYGMALSRLGQTEAAEVQLRAIDQRYSNYQERLELARFYLDQGKKEEAIDLLNEIYTESQHMKPENRKRYRSTIKDVEQLLTSL